MASTKRKDDDLRDPFREKGENPYALPAQPGGFDRPGEAATREARIRSNELALARAGAPSTVTLDGQHGRAPRAIDPFTPSPAGLRQPRFPSTPFDGEVAARAPARFSPGFGRPSAPMPNDVPLAPSVARAVASMVRPRGAQQVDGLRRMVAPESALVETPPQFFAARNVTMAEPGQFARGTHESPVFPQYGAWGDTMDSLRAAMGRARSQTHATLADNDLRSRGLLPPEPQQQRPALTPAQRQTALDYADSEWENTPPEQRHPKKPSDQWRELDHEHRVMLKRQNDARRMRKDVPKGGRGRGVVGGKKDDPESVIG